MENKKTNVIMMAFASGSESTDSGSFKRYVGVAPVFVLDVNPKKAELEKLYGTQLTKDPEYVTTVESDGKPIYNTRIDFIVKTDAKNCNGIELTTKVTFYLRNEYRYNKDKTKVQVIDKYGRTAWVTIEQARNHEIPIYSSGPANIDKEYRPAYIGEEDLTRFIKTYLNIPNVMRYINEKWVMVDNPQDCEARLDKIANYFKGDFSELKGAIKLQPNNKVKAMFGVKTSDDNKQYQTIYNQMFLRGNAHDYSPFTRSLQERKDAGAYSNVEFDTCELKEYTIEATTFTSTDNTFDDPFASSAGELPFD